MVLETIEVVAVRVPASRALALPLDGLVLLPEHGHERNPGFDQAAGHEKTHAIEGFPVTLADGLGFTPEIKGRPGGT